MVTTPMSVLRKSFKALASVFFEKTQATEAMIEQIVAFATKARKNGIVSLEQDVADVADPFLKKALALAVDGTDLQELRKMMELAISIDEHHAEALAKVFEGAGGYAPTIGILGAVLGLIHVMENLTDPTKLGGGIAVAFVATIYGIASANLIFLPIANKLKTLIHAGVVHRELVLDGLIGIANGENPKLVGMRLNGYLAAR